MYKRQHTGGKASLLVKDGFSFDMGPSLLTLPEWIDEIFTFCSKNPRDYYTFKKLSTVTRYFFSDKSHLDVKSNLNDTAEEFEKVGLAKNQFLDFMRKWDDIYSISSETFLENNIGFNKAYHRFYRPSRNVHYIPSVRPYVPARPVTVPVKDRALRTLR